jgi:WD40 repeat protein
VGSLATGDIVDWDKDMPEEVASMAFSPDGRRLYVCGGPIDIAKPRLKTVYVYDTAAKKAAKPIETDGSVVSVVSGPGGTHAILQKGDTDYRLLDLNTGSIRIRFPVVRPDRFLTAQLRPTGGVTVGYQNGLLQRFDDDGRLEYSNRFGPNHVTAFTDLPNGTTRHVHFSSAHFTVNDVPPGRNPKIRVRGGTDEAVRTPNVLGFGPSGRTLRVGYYHVGTWQFPNVIFHTQGEYHTSEYNLDHPGVVNRKVLSINDYQFVASSDMNRFLIFNNGQVHVTSYATGMGEYDVERLLQGNFSEDGKHILGVNLAGEFVVIDGEFGRTLRKVRLGLKCQLDDNNQSHFYTNCINNLRVRGDRVIFVVPPIPQNIQAKADAAFEERYTPGTVSIIDWRKCRLIAQYDCPELLPTEPYGLSAPFDISPDGRQLLHAVDKKLRVLDLSSGNLMFQYAAKDDVAYSHVKFGPDGRTFAAVATRESLTPDSTVEVWDAVGFAPWKRSRVIRGVSTAWPIARDGTRLATGGVDTTIIVWDVAGLPVGEVPEDREVAWKRLGEPDPAAAAGAARRLQRADGWSFLADRLKPDGHDLPSPDRIKRLVADLGAPAFATREAARKELTKHIRLLRNDLKAARNTVTDPEQKSRLDGLIETASVLPPPEDMRRSLRVVQLLRGSTDPEAKRVLATLAAGHPDGWLTERAKR